MCSNDSSMHVSKFSAFCGGRSKYRVSLSTGALTRSLSERCHVAARLNNDSKSLVLWATLRLSLSKPGKPGKKRENLLQSLRGLRYNIWNVSVNVGRFMDTSKPHTCIHSI